jgi:hypothetical membrane protein
MTDSNQKIAGALFFVGAVVVIMGIVLAEIFYPGYNVSSNFISDLGAFCRIQGGQYVCQINQPSSTIFNGCNVVFGVLVLLGSYFAYRTFRNRLFTILLVLTGIGITGVGIFPENVLGGTPHHIVSQMIFIFGGLSAIAAYRIERSPMNYFSVIMGVVTLAFWSFLEWGFLKLMEGTTSSNYLGLGVGGIERVVAYPLLLWVVGFGGYLMGSSQAS